MANANDDNLIDTLVNDFVNVISLSEPRPLKNCPTPTLDKLAADDKLQKIKDIVTAVHIPSFIQTLAKNRTNQASDEFTESVTKLVQGQLNSWINGKEPVPSSQHLPATYQNDLSVVDEDDSLAVDRNNHTYNIIIWSAELWFIRQLDSLLNENVQEKLQAYECDTLFSKYFSPVDDSEPRFTAILEKDACDLMRELMNMDNVRRVFEEFLKKFANVRKLNEMNMSGEMLGIVKKHSHVYYIYSERNMYAMHWYLEDHGGYHLEHAMMEATKIRHALNQWGFSKLEGPKVDSFHPEFGEFPELRNWLNVALSKIQTKCSLLFMTFRTHGFKGRMRDARPLLMDIETLLGWLNGSDELKAIPKVLVIQACQHEPMEEERLSCYTEDLEGDPLPYKEFTKSLKQIVKNQTEHTHLLMPAEEGKELNFLAVDGSFLDRIILAAKEVSEDASSEPTLERVYYRTMESQKLKNEYMASENKKHLLLPNSCSLALTEHPANEEDSDDDSEYDQSPLASVPSLESANEEDWLR